MDPLELSLNQGEDLDCFDDTLCREYDIFKHFYPELCDTVYEKSIMQYLVKEDVITPEQEDEIKCSKDLLKRISGPLKAGHAKSFDILLRTMTKYGDLASKELATKILQKISEDSETEHFDVNSFYRPPLSHQSSRRTLSRSRSPNTSVSNITHVDNPFSIDVQYKDAYNQVVCKLLEIDQNTIINLLKNLYASDEHKIPLFAEDLLQSISTSLRSNLQLICTWSDHSILKSISGKDAAPLHNFDDTLDLSLPVTDCPILTCNETTSPQVPWQYRQTHVVLSVTLGYDRILLQHVFEVRSLLVKKCCITEHALQLLAIQIIDSHNPVLHWMTPKCVMSLIGTNMIAHSRCLQQHNILEASIQSNQILSCLSEENTQFPENEKSLILEISSQRDQLMSQLTHSKENEQLVMEDLRKQWKRFSGLLHQHKELEQQLESATQKSKKEAESIGSYIRVIKQEVLKLKSTACEITENLNDTEHGAINGMANSEESAVDEEEIETVDIKGCLEQFCNKHIELKEKVASLQLELQQQPHVQQHQLSEATTQESNLFQSESKTSKDVKQQLDQGSNYNELQDIIINPSVAVDKDKIMVSKIALAPGNFGFLYSAKYCGKKCAVKVINCADVDKSIVTKEINMLSSLKHPCIVQLLGVFCDDKLPRVLNVVMEEMRQDLASFLSSAPRDIATKLSILCDVAYGLCYLHSKKVMHRNLTPQTILLTETLEAKISDFGQARLCEKDAAKFSKAPGDASYMPPEALTPVSVYNDKIDIFSMGCAIICTATQEIPYPAEKFVKQGDEFIKLSESERRSSHLSKIKSNPDAKLLYDLAVECLSNKPQKRPDAEMVCHSLERCKETLQYEGDKEPQKLTSLQQENSRLIQQLEEFKAKYKRDTDDLRDQLRSRKSQAGSLVKSAIVSSPTKEEDGDLSDQEYEDATDNMENSLESQLQTTIVGDTSAWKRAIKNNEHNLINGIQGITDVIASKLRQDISEAKYKQIVTTFGNRNKTSQLIHAIYACDEEFVFKKFCDVLVELNHTEWANKLRKHVASTKQ